MIAAFFNDLFYPSEHLCTRESGKSLAGWPDDNAIYTGSGFMSLMPHPTAPTAPAPSHGKWE